MKLALAMFRVLVPCCVAFLLATQVASASPAGSIDAGFGSGGVGFAAAPVVAANAVVAGPERILVFGDTSESRQLVVRGFTPSGVVLPGVGSTIPFASAGQTGVGVDAVAVDPASGRIIVLVSLFVKSSARSELLDVDSDGKLDSSFGDDGRLVLPGQPDGGGIAIAPDGTILVAATGELAPGQDVLYDRVSPDGVLVSQASVARTPGTTPVPVALSDGSALVAIGDNRGDGGAELLRFDASGNLDRAFGRRGVVRLRGPIEIDAGTADGADRVLFAGAHLATYSRSAFNAASPLLMRVSVQGQVDRDFGHVGRGIGGAFVFSAVAVDGDRILAATPSGAVASLPAATGDADPTFGVGGVSPAPGARFGQGGPFTLDGSLAVMAGARPGAPPARRGLTLAGVNVAGAGVLPAQAGRRVTVDRVAGTVGITVPLSAVEQPLSAPIASALPPGGVNHGDDGIYTPTATVLDARHGTVAIDGSGGRATVHGGVVSLRRRRGAVATIVAARRPCTAVTLRLDGRFGFGIGATGPRFVTVTPRSRLQIRPCDSQRPVKVLAGRVQAAGHGPRLP